MFLIPPVSREGTVFLTFSFQVLPISCLSCSGGLTFCLFPFPDSFRSYLCLLLFAYYLLHHVLIYSELSLICYFTGNRCKPMYIYLSPYLLEFLIQTLYRKTHNVDVGLVNYNVLIINGLSLIVYFL